MLGLRKALCVGGGNGPAKKVSSSDKGIADADMPTADMAASNQVGISCMRPQLRLISVDTLSHHRFVCFTQQEL